MLSHHGGLTLRQHVSCTTVLVSSAATVRSRMTRDGGTGRERRPLTTSDASGIDVWWLFLGGESKGTILNCAFPIGIFEWPGLGHTLSASPWPIDLGVGE